MALGDYSITCGIPVLGKIMEAVSPKIAVVETIILITLSAHQPSQKLCKLKQNFPILETPLLSILLWRPNLIKLLPIHYWVTTFRETVSF